MSEPPRDLLAALTRLGLLPAGEIAPAEALAGGVSSDIWRVDLPDGPVCVKRALAKLKVEADWQVPVERSGYEIAWMETVAGIDPGIVPRLLASDAESGLFVMPYLDPADYPVWKDRLMDGQADPAFAESVGQAVVRIHAATAGNELMAMRFDSGEIFHAIRLDPYLLAAARRHPDRADAIRPVVATTAETRLALVHGDVSPKNILIGPTGPVFLDAECAWYGDPAFDLAFCLNHLLLKCVHRPPAAPGYLACFDALANAYMAGVDWEPPKALENRVARLLPGLMLARVDGKSPLEYLDTEAQQDAVRRTARTLLAAPVDTLAALRARWAEDLALGEGKPR